MAHRATADYPQRPAIDLGAVSSQRSVLKGLMVALGVKYAGELVRC